MTINIWQGERVRLRAIEPGDWEAFHAFDQSDTEMARTGSRIHFPRSAERARTWAAEMAAAEPKNDNYRLAVADQEGRVVGSISTRDCDAHNGTFEYGIAIGAPYRRAGYAREAITLLLGYFFGELRYQKCNVQVYAFNEPSMRLHEQLGFRLEGRLRRQVFSGGTYHDELLYGITSEEFFGRVPAVTAEAVHSG